MRNRMRVTTPPTAPFELLMCCAGCGTTYCNKAVNDPDTRDYLIVAHSNDHGVLSWHVNKSTIPVDEAMRIERDAERDHAKWLEQWSKTPTASQYQTLLDAMTITELLEWNGRTREQKSTQHAPVDLAEIVAEILRDGLCKNAQRFYGLGSA